MEDVNGESGLVCLCPEKHGIAYSAFPTLVFQLAHTVNLTITPEDYIMPFESKCTVLIA
jgi:hypothetical protein